MAHPATSDMTSATADHRQAASSESGNAFSIPGSCVLTCRRQRSVCHAARREEGHS